MEGPEIRVWNKRTAMPYFGSRHCQEEGGKKRNRKQKVKRGNTGLLNEEPGCRRALAQGIPGQEEKKKGKIKLDQGR